MKYEEEYLQYLLSKRIKLNMPEEAFLMEAASQIKLPTSVFLKERGLTRQKISKLYAQLFDLSNKTPSTSVNQWMYKQFLKDKGLLLEDTTKHCNDCGLELNITEFYANGYTPNGTKKYKPNCKKCFDKLKKDKMYSAAEQVFTDIKCVICGYDTCKQALEFHHRNPKEKEFHIAELRSKTIEAIKIELEKCVILCANCHRETHYGLHPQYLDSSD